SGAVPTAGCRVGEAVVPNCDVREGRGGVEPDRVVGAAASVHVAWLIEEIVLDQHVVRSRTRPGGEEDPVDRAVAEARITDRYVVGTRDVHALHVDGGRIALEVVDRDAVDEDVVRVAAKVRVRRVARQGRGDAAVRAADHVDVARARL